MNNRGRGYNHFLFVCLYCVDVSVSQQFFSVRQVGKEHVKMY